MNTQKVYRGKTGKIVVDISGVKSLESINAEFNDEFELIETIEIPDRR